MHRRSIRLGAYDYSDPGWYFVTVCTKDREPLFGRIRNERVELSREGSIARRCIRDISRHFKRVRIASFIVMPDHVHVIIQIKHERLRKMVDYKITSLRRGAACCAPTDDQISGYLSLRRYGDMRPESLSVIVRSFKSAVSKIIHRMTGFDHPVWQRNYHERVIRNERELFDTVMYIKDNPIEHEL